nr:MAG TPA: hypothetical protein [Caudoviricetes sp.]
MALSNGEHLTGITHIKSLSPTLPGNTALVY